MLPPLKVSYLTFSFSPSDNNLIKQMEDSQNLGQHPPQHQKYKPYWMEANEGWKKQTERCKGEEGEEVNTW